MIELGLARISHLVKNISMPWRAIHVAGTNGKGSVCSYTSAMLKAGNIRCGRFTSPHLIDKWDCITINDQTVDPKLFHQVEDTVRSWDRRDGIGASEFELLTATAFEIFTREKVQVAVVEVGVGGRHDATNVIEDPLVTVITKISMDHESLLGKSLAAIAHQKAGIIKTGAHCVVDGTNDSSVLDVIKENVKTAQAASLTLVPQHTSQGGEVEEHLEIALKDAQLEPHQQANLSVAYGAIKHAMQHFNTPIGPHLLTAALEASWPGRLQTVDLSNFTSSDISVLVDGAHNVSSAEVLASYVDRRIRTSGPHVTWVLAFSRGKRVRELLDILIRPGDDLIPAEFGPVDGMPWVRPMTKAEILDAARGEDPLPLRRTLNVHGSLEDICRVACGIAEGRPIVIAGSLYLVSDLFRVLRYYE